MTKRNTHSSYNLSEQASNRRREDKEGDDYQEDDIEILFTKDVSKTI